MPARTGPGPRLTSVQPTLGSVVVHTTFGQGQALGLARDAVTVRFADGKKRLLDLTRAALSLPA